MSRKLFDGAKVTIDGSLGVITTLEFFQHHFSKMGHRDLLVTQNLSHPSGNHCFVHLTRSVRRRAALFKSSSKKVAAKSFILQGGAVATFFRPCLGGAQSIAYRKVAFCPRKELATYRDDRFSSVIRLRKGWRSLPLIFPLGHNRQSDRTNHILVHQR